MQINTASDALDNLNKKLGGADIEIEPSTNKVDALKKIYKTLGGTDDVKGLSTVYQVLEKITEVAEGGGGGGIENVTLVVTNGRTGDSIYLPDYFEPAYPSIINNTLQAVSPKEVAIEAQASYTLNIAHSSVPTEISMPSFDDEPVGSGNVVVTYDEESKLYKLSISGDCAITILPQG